MIFWAYMLHCRGGAYYTGHTNNLDHRVAQHQIGAIAGFTAERLPVELVWSQEFPSRLDALTAEKQIKGWSRAKKMALIRGDWAAISALAKGKNSPSTSSGQTGFVGHAPPRTVRPELVEGLSLLCHPDTPSRGVSRISAIVEYSRKRNCLAVIFHVVAPSGFFLPDWQYVPSETPQRRDGLWQTTCFELFAKREGESGYLEYNFSPTGAFALYAFDGYRAGMQKPDVVQYCDMDQVCWDQQYQMDVDPVFLGSASTRWHLALSAVIEEADGSKSYWALRHPPGKPDFHHPDCFALTLEAPPPA
jgi:putative endonuclease